MFMFTHIRFIKLKHTFEFSFGIRAVLGQQPFFYFFYSTPIFLTARAYESEQEQEEKKLIRHYSERKHVVSLEDVMLQ